MGFNHYRLAEKTAIKTQIDAVRNSPLEKKWIAKPMEEIQRMGFNGIFITIDYSFFKGQENERRQAYLVSCATVLTLCQGPT